VEREMKKQKCALAISCIALLFFSGCRKYIPATSKDTTSNAQIEVHLVLEHDGIKVYRFWDGVRTIYYTDARGKTSWDEVHSTGKTTYIERHEVETTQ
jgi:hypothetical protein